MTAPSESPTDNQVPCAISSVYIRNDRLKRLGKDWNTGGWGGERSKSKQPCTKSNALALINTEINFHTQITSGNLGVGGKGERVTRKKTIPELNMRQRSHYYIDDRYIKC